MDYSEEVKKLAETLKSSGLAASMGDALEKAQSMLGKKEAEEKIEEELFERETDAAQTTLGDVKEPKEKKAIDESLEAQEGLKKEEVFTNNPDNKEKQESNQKKVDYSREKKVDLNKVFDVNR